MMNLILGKSATRIATAVAFTVAICLAATLVPPPRDQFAAVGRVAAQPTQFSRLLWRGHLARVSEWTLSLDRELRKAPTENASVIRLGMDSRTKS